MYYKKILLAALLFLLSAHITFAQKGEVNVNLSTGTGNVTIPIYTLSRGQVVLPISLTYNGGGIKPKDVEGTAGMGWQINAGGQISRQVRGLPDDIKVDMSYTTRLGWMYSGMQSVINGFTIHNSADTACAGQQLDIAEIATDFGNQKDIEPDIFNVSAPGLSCQLVYDQASASFKTIPYMDIKITPAYFDSSAGRGIEGRIKSFSITNDKGITYLFGAYDIYNSAIEYQTQQTTPVSGGTTGTYNQNYFQQYQNYVEYGNAWNLLKMTDVNGNGVTLSYNDYQPRSGKDTLILYGGGSGGTTTAYKQYITQTNVSPKTLASIQTIDNNGSNQVLTFNWSVNADGGATTNTGQVIINSITGAGRNIIFSYSRVAYTGSKLPYIRNFLRNFMDASTGEGCGTPVNYQFAYYGETLSSGSYTTVLSDSTSTKHIDYWGYYTRDSGDNTVTDLYIDPTNTTAQRYVIPQTAGVGSAYTVHLTGSGANRTPDADSVMMGSLKTITYAQGGSTTITYESNDFYDPAAGVVNQGGGIRVKKIVDTDNVASATVTRNYSYVDAATSVSSGKPLSLPIYGFTTVFTGSTSDTDYWNKSTMRSNIDLSQDDHTVMYSYVTVSQSGAGSTVYQYYVPATNWDASAYPSCDGCNTGSPEWYRTVNYSANPNCPTSAGPPKNDIDTYPFAPNPNYDFERGLIKSVTTYNQDSTPKKTSETDYAYVRTSSPATIPAFKYEGNMNNSGEEVISYAKYIIYYGTSELTSQETKTVYDPLGTSLVQTTTSNSTYGSVYHQLATQAVTNSDGRLLTSHYTYTKDFTGLSSGNANPNINAIYQLQQLNVDIPVESYTTVTPAGGSAAVINASATLFSNFPGHLAATMYMPASQLKFVVPDGGGAFTPMSISGSTLTKDSRYINTANFLQYDFTGVVQTADDAHKHVQGSVLDHITYQPVVAVQNAAAYEIAFQDFDSDMVPPWTESFGGFTGTQPTGSHTGMSRGMNPDSSFTYTIQKNTLTNNYIFSIWLNPGASGTFNFTMTPVSPTTGTPTSASIPFNNTDTTWQYFERMLTMPATGGTGNTVAVKATLSSSANVGVDDILLYPQTASVNTGAFDTLTYYRTAQTNTNGVSSYYTTDQWGRPLLQFDQDKNIVKKNFYVVSDVIPAFPKPSFLVDPWNNVENPIYTTTLVTCYPLNWYSSCYTYGLTYAWDFGDGTTISPSYSYTPVTHRFNVDTISKPTPYTITFTVASPTFGTFSYTQNVLIHPGSAPPPTTALTYTNSTYAKGSIGYVEFSQGGTVIYTFTGDQLKAGQNIVPGVYDIKVYMGPSVVPYNPGTGFGYASVTAGSDCRNYDPSNQYTFSGIDLTGLSSFAFLTDIVTCP